VLFTFSNSESGDRSLDLVALDLVTGELLLAPWGRAEGWFADGAAWWPTGDALIISRYARREDPESAFWTRVPVDPAEPVIPLAAGPIRGEPVPSPDGAWTGIYGWGDAAQAAFVRSDGSGDPVFGPRGQIVWSPDGRRAAILSDDYRLAVFDTVARKVTDLAAEAWPLSSLSGQPAVVWSPGGSEVLYNGGPCGLCAVDVETGLSRTVIDESAVRLNAVLGWGPGGLLAIIPGARSGRSATHRHELLLRSCGSGPHDRRHRGLVLRRPRDPDRGCRDRERAEGRAGPLDEPERAPLPAQAVPAPVEPLVAARAGRDA